MKIKLTLLLLTTCFASTLFSQGKTNEIGLFIAPGTYAGTYAVKNNYSGFRFSNYNIGFGAFYQRGLSDHFVYRVSFGGRHEVFNIHMNNEHYYKNNQKSFLIELIPIQVHYIFNPSNKLQAYAGLNLGISKTFSIKSTSSKDGQVAFVTVFKNQPFDFFPSIVAGVNYRVKEKLTLIFQPEYRPLNITHTGMRSFRNGLNFQFGLSFRV